LQTVLQHDNVSELAASMTMSHWTATWLRFVGRPTTPKLVREIRHVRYVPEMLTSCDYLGPGRRGEGSRTTTGKVRSRPALVEVVGWSDAADPLRVVTLSCESDSDRRGWWASDDGWWSGLVDISWWRRRCDVPSRL